MSTYTQIYIQTVFAVMGRESLILPQWEERLHKYLTGIVQNKEQKMPAINGMPDHVHFLDEYIGFLKKYSSMPSASRFIYGFISIKV
ncbi:MAG: transposase [Bacteroidales bacterium]|nr:transposase [Bacteroidales bacterium]